MMQPYNFDEIRPYNDSEVRDVLQSLIKEDVVLKMVKSLFPEKDINDIIALSQSINTIDEFQEKFIHKMVRRVASNSTDGISISGFDNMNKDESYLLISNHRDIILDSAFLNILLKENEFKTTEIAIGDNLLIYKWITDIVKLNKSFVVHRDAPVKLLVEYSKRLSTYIRTRITGNKNSVWIAQREGRAKDGNDKTQPGLLKMFHMSADKDFYESFSELNLTPFCLSYEYDPCDAMKIGEVYLKLNNIPYKKTKEDDINSMVTGIQGYKGRVHLAVGKALKEELKEAAVISNKNEQMKKLAEIIDEHMYQLYHLWPNNYIAYDMLQESNEFEQFYSEQEKQDFGAYIAKKVAGFQQEPEKHKELLLKFYSYPLVNKLKLK
jgi:hypothetical protein